MTSSHGIVWSHILRDIEADAPLPTLPGWSAPSPLAPSPTPPGPLCAPPDLDLGEAPPPATPARAYTPEPAPPSRRGWLLRAIEGIFG